MSYNNKDMVILLSSLLAIEQRFNEAEKLLFSLIRLNKDADALDLLAKIYAQQRKFDEAEEIWTLALDTDKTNINYSKALIKCHEMKQNKTNNLNKYIIVLLILIFVALCIVILQTIF
ncbi:MAG: hypothetical protein LBU40_03000 [Methanobrevibacter sp.]|jgi:tetratricopeptide (TPR) repeat protein|nr:hypothetical protein [Methanobrevibacter sp.]